MQKNLGNIILLKFLLFGVILIAQNTDHTIKIDIPEVALLSIQKPANQQVINITPVLNEAGDAITYITPYNETWINYSSIIGSKTEPSRFVYLQITEGTLPKGLELVLNVGNDVAMGAGHIGSPVEQTLVTSNQPYRIIDNIGSCYTGAGNTKGHMVTYTIKKNEDFNAQWLTDFNTSTALQLTYTLSDN